MASQRLDARALSAEDIPRTDEQRLPRPGPRRIAASHCPRSPRRDHACVPVHTRTAAVGSACYMLRPRLRRNGTGLGAGATVSENHTVFFNTSTINS